MNTDDLKYELEVFWDKVVAWCKATWAIIQSYFKGLDQYEYIGWGANAIALVLIIVAFI